ncbi:hypothetical protein EHS39_21645 [Ensifer sp. MPMI2T]|nr:hypothetical protein EHS39_21645 [Ensifer sp. MPMI2T]
MWAVLSARTPHLYLLKRAATDSRGALHLFLCMLQPKTGVHLRCASPDSVDQNRSHLRSIQDHRDRVSTEAAGNVADVPLSRRKVLF